MDIMFDALFITSKSNDKYDNRNEKYDRDRKNENRSDFDKEKNMNNIFREPLSALVDYKGFRAITYALIPVQPYTGMIMGFYNSMYNNDTSPEIK